MPNNGNMKSTNTNHENRKVPHIIEKILCDIY